MIRLQIKKLRGLKLSVNNFHFPCKATEVAFGVGFGAWF